MPEAYILTGPNNQKVIWIPTEAELEDARKVAPGLNLDPLNLAAYRVFFPIGAIRLNQMPYDWDIKPLKEYGKGGNKWELKISVQQEVKVEIE